MSPEGDHHHSVFLLQSKHLISVTISPFHNHSFQLFQFLMAQSLQVYKQPTVNQKLSAIDIGTQITAQEDGWTSEITRDAGATKRYPTLHVLSLFLIRQILFIELCLDCARQQRIAPNVVFAERARRRLDEREDASFCRRVVTLLGAADERADGRDADYRAAWRRLCRHLSCAGLDGVECACEVGG